MDLFYIHNDLFIIHQLINPNQCNKYRLLNWTIPGCWLKWTLGYFLFSVEGSNRWKMDFWVFFGGTMKLWGDQLQYDAKNTYVILRPSIHVNHLFFAVAFLPSLTLIYLFAAFFQLWPPTQHVKNGYNQYWRKNPAASVESKVLDPHQFTPSLVSMKESRHVLKVIRFEMLRTKALQGHIYPCSHVHGRMLPFSRMSCDAAPSFKQKTFSARLVANSSAISQGLP